MRTKRTPAESNISLRTIISANKVAVSPRIPKLLDNFSDGQLLQPRTQSQLIDPIGRADEQVDELGKRMLLLLESRPIYRPDLFDVLVNKIFEKYANYVTSDTDKKFAFLANDLIRNFRFICVNYQFNFWRQSEKWPLRNLKLRHSRIVMY